MKRLKLRMGTFFWHRQLPRLCNLDGLDRLVPRALLHILNLLNDIVAFQNLTKDDVLSIQPSSVKLVQNPKWESEQQTHEVMAVVMKN